MITSEINPTTMNSSNSRGSDPSATLQQVSELLLSPGLQSRGYPALITAIQERAGGHMHLVFGMAADRRPYPEHPGRAHGAVAASVVGPAGLLDLLSSQLGLGGPPAAPVVRIATWQTKLEAAAEAVPRFWSASLAADAWSSARLILSWRDSLIEVGWNATRLPCPPARLADLAAAEQAGPILPRGRSDLLREVVSAIAGGEPLDLDTVELIESLSLLPPGWRELMMALETAGVLVRPVPGFVPVEAGTDIGRLHQFIRSGTSTPIAGDGTVTEVEAHTALMAAECVAEWIASDPEAARETVIVAPDGDSALLDQALARHGLPRLGLSAASPYRGALQVLSLAFAVAWKPVDPQKLLELLLLPRPPIPRWAAGTLAYAIAQQPGIGGPAWQWAWQRLEDKLRARAADDAALDVDGTLQAWRAWMSVGRFDRKAGMPAIDAIAICQRVLEWAIELDAGSRDPLLLCVVAAARALIEALKALGRSPVTSLQVDRMIDHAIAEGLPNPDHYADEGLMRAVSSPGALWGGAARVVWWNFTGGATALPACPWSAAERAALAASGCSPEHPGDAARREAFHWQIAVLNAQSAILFVRPALNRGTEASNHPLAHQLGPILRPAGERRDRRLQAERLLVRERVPLGAREIIRSLTITVDLPRPQPVWSLPASLVARIEDRRESASSFEDLLACQMRWMLKHVARLRSDSARSIPDHERLFGNLAHALAQIVFVPGTIPDPVQVRQQARSEIDGLVERIAAPLLLPGLARELAFARERIPEALATLAEGLARGRFSIVGIETEREQAFGNLRVTSRIDMVVRDPAGREGVIDLKWTNSPTRRRAEIADGRAIQLATYSRLLAPDGGAPAGYFLIKQRRLLVEAGSALAGDEVSVIRTLDDTWHAITADWRNLTRIGREGQALATGLPGVEDHLPEGLTFLPDDKVCTYCEFGRLCRTPANG